MLLAAPGGLGKGRCAEEDAFFFVTVRENLSFCGDFRAPDRKACKNKVNIFTKQGERSTRLCWYQVLLVRTSTRCGRLSVSDHFSGMYIG